VDVEVVEAAEVVDVATDEVVGPALVVVLNVGLALEVVLNEGPALVAGAPPSVVLAPGDPPQPAKGTARPMRSPAKKIGVTTPSLPLTDTSPRATWDTRPSGPVRYRRQY
jgi:hypothetical protein